MTDADIAALTRRLAGTAVDYKELYEAAKRDAEEAEAYAAELEAKLEALDHAYDSIVQALRFEALRTDDAETKLARAVEALRECEADIDGYIWHEYPGDHSMQARYRKRDLDANPARIALAELKGQDDD